MKTRFTFLYLAALVIIIISCRSHRETTQSTITESQTNMAEADSIIPADGGLEGKKWMLTELMGEKIDTARLPKPAFIHFEASTGKVSGNTSCNNFFGPYELLEGNRIKLGDIASTMMACPEGTIEGKFFEMLSQADNYIVSDSTLSLNKARMNPLARFKQAKSK